MADRLRVLVAGWLNSPHVVAWVEALAAAGHDVHLAGRSAPQWPETEATSNLHRLPTAGPPGLRGLRMSRALKDVADAGRARSCPCSLASRVRLDGSARKSQAARLLRMGLGRVASTRLRPAQVEACTRRSGPRVCLICEPCTRCPRARRPRRSSRGFALGARSRPVFARRQGRCAQGSGARARRPPRCQRAWFRPRLQPTTVARGFCASEAQRPDAGCCSRHPGNHAAGGASCDRPARPRRGCDDNRKRPGGRCPMSTVRPTSSSPIRRATAHHEAFGRPSPVAVRS